MDLKKQNVERIDQELQQQQHLNINVEVGKSFHTLQPNQSSIAPPQAPGIACDAAVLQVHDSRGRFLEEH